MKYRLCAPRVDKRYETLFEAKNGCKDANCTKFYYHGNNRGIRGFYLCIDHAYILEDYVHASIVYIKSK